MIPPKVQQPIDCIGYEAKHLYKQGDITTSGRLMMQCHEIESALEEMQQAHLEHLASWALNIGLSTGHADTVQGLLDEVEWQIKEMRQRAKEMQQERQALIDAATERAAKVCSYYCVDDDGYSDDAKRATKAIRALIGQPLPESGKEGLI